MQYFEADLPWVSVSTQGRLPHVVTETGRRGPVLRRAAAGTADLPGPFVYVFQQMYILF